MECLVCGGSRDLTTDGRCERCVTMDRHLEPDPPARVFVCHTADALRIQKQRAELAEWYRAELAKYQSMASIFELANEFTFKFDAIK